MIKIVVEKKAKYMIATLIFISLLSLIANSNVEDNFYNTISQIAKSPSDLNSIDGNNDGIIDEAESVNRSVKISDYSPACPTGYLVREFNEDGIPKCIRPRIVCQKNKCLIVASTDDEELERMMPYSVDLIFNIQMQGNTSMDDITIKTSLQKDQPLTLDQQYCRVDDNPHNQYDQDTFCVKTLTLTQDYLDIYIDYKNQGSERFIDKIDIRADINTRNLIASYNLTSPNDEEKRLRILINN